MDFMVSRILVLTISAAFFGSTNVFSGAPQSFVSWSDIRMEEHYANSNLIDGRRSRVIRVSKDGTGNSTTIQGAVDMVPVGNKERTKIYISQGVYRSAYSHSTNP
ncbi:hypothetical protein HPP92_023351 [Vanilla planifolia]|uniref:Pectinesterase catalytic domain-containing protein n=1 Tax=Vanilla planifolia TaxID=51239 RepID=A0A835UGA1_VANPL|nr:hypothetical protein HPP92_023351 [Vanilla planifolia]